MKNVGNKLIIALMLFLTAAPAFAQNSLVEKWSNASSDDLHDELTQRYILLTKLEDSLADAQVENDNALIGVTLETVVLALGTRAYFKTQGRSNRVLLVISGLFVMGIEIVDGFKLKVKIQDYLKLRQEVEQARAEYSMLYTLQH